MKTFTISEKNSVSEVRWSIRAMSTDATRYILCRLLVDEDFIVSTDGRRLHRLDKGLVPQLAEFTGQLEVISNTAKVVVLREIADGSNFPHWKAVLPDLSDPDWLKINGKTMDANTAISNIAVQTRTVFNSDFFLDAIGSGTLCPKRMTWSFDVYHKPLAAGDISGQNPIVFKDENRLSLIMPLRLN